MSNKIMRMQPRSYKASTLVKTLKDSLSDIRKDYDKILDSVFDTIQDAGTKLLETLWKEEGIQMTQFFPITESIDKVVKMFRDGNDHMVAGTLFLGTDADGFEYMFNVAFEAPKTMHGYIETESIIQTVRKKDGYIETLIKNDKGTKWDLIQETVLDQPLCEILPEEQYQMVGNRSVSGLAIVAKVVNMIPDNPNEKVAPETVRQGVDKMLSENGKLIELMSMLKTEFTLESAENCGENLICLTSQLFGGMSVTEKNGKLCLYQYLPIGIMIDPEKYKDMNAARFLFADAIIRPVAITDNLHKAAMFLDNICHGQRAMEEVPEWIIPLSFESAVFLTIEDLQSLVTTKNIVSAANHTSLSKEERREWARLNKYLEPLREQ